MGDDKVKKTYEELAPTLVKAGYKESQVNKFLDKPAKPVDKNPVNPDPEITSEAIDAIATAYYETGFQKDGGMLKVAQKNKLKSHQVKQIIKDLDAVKATREESVTDE